MTFVWVCPDIRGSLSEPPWLQPRSMLSQIQTLGQVKQRGPRPTIFTARAQNSATRNWTAGFGPCFHLPGFHCGYVFLTHSHLCLIWALVGRGKNSAVRPAQAKPDRRGGIGCRCRTRPAGEHPFTSTSEYAGLFPWFWFGSRFHCWGSSSHFLGRKSERQNRGFSGPRWFWTQK